MDRYRNLFKQNNLRSKRNNKVQEFLQGRKNRRSEAMDTVRQFTPEDFVIEGEEKLPTSASKKQNRPFVVGKVRHKIHSPPFLHQPVGSKEKRKITPLKSFAPTNYQFRKRFLINSPSPTKYENYRLSPFSKKSSSSKKTNSKLAKPDGDHVTMRSYKKVTPANPHPNEPLNTPVFGRENCEDIHGNARKQLWPDPSEEVIFGRSNVARALKLKDSTPRSPQGPFEIKSREISITQEKEDIISSSLMFHKKFEKIVQNMDTDYSDQFDVSEPGRIENSQSFVNDNELVVAEQGAPSNNQDHENDDSHVTSRVSRITTRSPHRLIQNRSDNKDSISKSLKSSHEDRFDDESSQNSLSNDTKDMSDLTNQSLLNTENDSSSFNLGQADVLNKAFDVFPENISHHCGQKNASNLSSPISLECREEMMNSSPSTDNSHKSSDKEDQSSSEERTDLLFLRTTTSLDCTEKQTRDSLEKFDTGMDNNKSYEALSDISSPTLLVRNPPDSDESLTMQIFPPIKGSSSMLRKKEEIVPSRIAALNNGLEFQKVAEYSTTDDFSPLATTEPSPVNVLDISSTITTDLEVRKGSLSPEKNASIEEFEDPLDVHLSDDNQNISSLSIREEEDPDGEDLKKHERISQNYYGVSRINVYVDPPLDEQRCSTAVRNKSESSHDSFQENDESLYNSTQRPEMSFSKRGETSNGSAKSSSSTRSLNNSPPSLQVRNSDNFDELNDTKVMETEPSDGSDESPMKTPHDLPRHSNQTDLSLKRATFGITESNAGDFKSSSVSHSPDRRSKPQFAELRRSSRLSQTSNQINEDVSIPENLFASTKTSLQNKEIASNSNTSFSNETTAKDYEVNSEDEINDVSTISLGNSGVNQRMTDKSFSLGFSSVNVSQIHPEFEIRISKQFPIAETADEKYVEVKADVMQTLSSSQRKGLRSSSNQMKSTEQNCDSPIYSMNESSADSSQNLLELMASQELEESVGDSSIHEGGEKNTLYTSRRSSTALVEPHGLGTQKEFLEDEILVEILSRKSRSSLKSNSSEVDKSFSNTDSPHSVNQSSVVDEKLQEVKNDGELENVEDHSEVQSRKSEYLGTFTNSEVANSFSSVDRSFTTRQSLAEDVGSHPVEIEEDSERFETLIKTSSRKSRYSSRFSISEINKSSTYTDSSIPATQSLKMVSESDEFEADEVLGSNEIVNEVSMNDSKYSSRSNNSELVKSCSYTSSSHAEQKSSVADVESPEIEASKKLESIKEPNEISSRTSRCMSKHSNSELERSLSKNHSSHMASESPIVTVVSHEFETVEVPAKNVTTFEISSRKSRSSMRLDKSGVQESFPSKDSSEDGSVKNFENEVDPPNLEFASEKCNESTSLVETEIASINTKQGESMRAADISRTPVNKKKEDHRVVELLSIENNKENLEPNHNSMQGSPYKLRIRTPKNQSSPAMILKNSTPSQSRDEISGNTSAASIKEEISNASSMKRQEKKKYLGVSKLISTGTSEEGASVPTSPYSLRIRTPKSQNSTNKRTPLKSRENVEIGSEKRDTKNTPESAKTYTTEEKKRRKGRLGKCVAENETDNGDPSDKLGTKMPQNQELSTSAEPDLEVEPVLETQTTKRRRAVKASSKNTIQDELGIHNSPYKLRARTPRNGKKEATLTVDSTPLKSQDEVEQSAETEKNQDGNVATTLSDAATVSCRGKKPRKAAKVLLKSQDEVDENTKPEMVQMEELPKTLIEPDKNQEGPKCREIAKNVTKNLVIKQTGIPDSPSKLRNKTPITQKGALENSTPCKSQEKIADLDVEEVARDEVFQTPNEPGVKSLDKKKSRRAVKNISESLAVEGASDEGSRYKLRSRTPKSQKDTISVENKKSSSKKTPQKKRTRGAVARALPMDLPGIVIDFENPSTVDETNENSPPSTPKSPIVVPFRKENPQTSKQQEVEAVDIASDDEELDYREFLARVIAKRALEVTLSPMTPSLNARRAKTPNKIPGLCITSETPKTPLTIVPAPIEESPKASMASPMRLLSLRNRAISITPSPKKKTPRVTTFSNDLSSL
ncbi:hypothetical protein QAD02_018796 [Eretmocerus hayati]|uniref:Uncharacterized protein n=1 Tax=Eretmocerus hayati TaxID=131215 RepID=A0ACC2PHD4_9HYME|nr:hypothetical protein QAD02_018796 [Eretmocerus hayati]